jgi:hypothetical protein
VGPERLAIAHHCMTTCQAGFCLREAHHSMAWHVHMCEKGHLVRAQCRHFVCQRALAVIVGAKGVPHHCHMGRQLVACKQGRGCAASMRIGFLVAERRRLLPSVRFHCERLPAQ